MRVKEVIRKSVLFLGYRGKNEDEIVVEGTGFYMSYDGFPYLITAGHIAEQFGDDPFVVRVNQRSSGKGTTIHADQTPWIFHADYPAVDLAAMPGSPSEPDLDLIALADDFLLTPDEFRRRELGPGDRCHIVGLFRLLHGKERNLPVVHTGWIAMMPDDEPIPTLDGRPGKEDEIIYVNGYLVEAQTLEGLSGSPVFVDQTERWKLEGGMGTSVAKLDTRTALLGVWQAAWSFPPDEVRSGVQAPKKKTGTVIPVGMGIVVPATRIVELMNQPNAIAERAERLRQGELSRAANRSSVSDQRTSENPEHREDFTALLNAAARPSLVVKG